MNQHLVKAVYPENMHVNDSKGVTTIRHLKNLFVSFSIVFFLLSGCSKPTETTPCVLRPIAPKSTPQFLNQSAKIDDYVQAVFLHDNLGFIEMGNSLAILDLDNPLEPMELGTYIGWTAPFMVKENFAYSFWNEELHILDISNPNQLVEVGCPEINQLMLGNARFSNSYAFAPKGIEGLKIFDISELTSLQEVASYQSFSSPELYWYKSPENIFPQPFYLPSEPMIALDVAISGQYAFLGEGLFGIDSYYGGQLTILDISNPLKPQRVGIFPMPQNGVAQKIIINNNIAFVWSFDPYGAQYTIALDISNPEQPVLVTSFPNSSLLGVYEDYVYFYDYEKGLLVWEISNPTSPKFVGTIELPLGFSSRYSGIGVFISDIQFKNNFAYLAMEYSGLKIIDVSDPANTKSITVYGPP